MPLRLHSIPLIRRGWDHLRLSLSIIRPGGSHQSRSDQFWQQGKTSSDHYLLPPIQERVRMLFFVLSRASGFPLYKKVSGKRVAATVTGAYLPNCINFNTSTQRNIPGKRHCSPAWSLHRILTTVFSSVPGCKCFYKLRDEVYAFL